MITNDFLLVLGMVIGILAIPGIFSAIVDRNPPRVASFAVVVAGALMLYAIYNKPGGYELQDLPDVIGRVVADFL